MTVKDLSHLPTANKPEGLAPDDDQSFVRVLVDQLAVQPAKPQVSDTLTRHSSAGSCLKRVALLRDGVEPDPMDLAGYHVTNIGTLVHEAWQDALAQQYPHAQFEVGTIIEDLTSGSCDALIDFGPDGNSVPIRLEAVRGEDQDHGGRLLDVDGSDGGRVPGVPRQHEDGAARGASGERVRVPGSHDPGGDDGGSSVQAAGVREPGSPGHRDATGERGGSLGERERAQRGQDPLPDGAPVLGGEPSGASGSEGVRDLRTGAQAGRVPPPKDPGTVRHVLELKTQGGFSHKMMVGERGVAQGPKSGHMVQLALNVMGHDAHRGTLIYLSNEAISKGAADRKGIDEVTRFGAQWTFTREQLQPLADEWLEQLRYVRDHPTDEVPRFWPHETPRGARIVDPNSSRWELRDGDDIIDTGSVWGGQGCAYCPVQTACAKAWADGR